MYDYNKNRIESFNPKKRKTKIMSHQSKTKDDYYNDQLY